MKHGDRRRFDEGCQILAAAITAFRVDADPQLLNRLDNAALILEDLSRRTRADRSIATAFASLAAAVAG